MDMLRQKRKCNYPKYSIKIREEGKRMKNRKEIKINSNKQKAGNEYDWVFYMSLAETVLAQHQNNKILRKKLNQEDR